MYEFEVLTRARTSIPVLSVLAEQESPISIRKLQKLMSLSVSTVQRAVSRLVSCGLVEEKRGKRGQVYCLSDYARGSAVAMGLVAMYRVSAQKSDV